MADSPFTELPEDFQVPEKFAQVVDPNGPPPMKMMASRGIVAGASPSEMLHVLYALTFDPNEQISEGCTKALAETPANILKGAINDQTHAAVLDFLVRRHIQDEELLELFVLRKQVHDETLYHVAETAPHLKVVEIVAKNQERLLSAPKILEGLKANPITPKSLVDVTTAFLQMAGVLPVGAEARTEGLPDRIDQDLIDALLDDEEFDEDLLGDDDDDAPVTEEETEEVKKSLAEMSIPEKVKLAYKGNKGARAVLLRDPNKVVVKAVLTSGRLTEGEAISLTKNRSIDSEVLKHIAADRDLRKRYEVKVNLASNPKTPQGIAIKLLRELRIPDLKSISKNRNVPGTVSAQAKRLADMKSGTRRK